MIIDRPTYAFGLGFAIAALFNGLLVVAKEGLPSLLGWMNALTGHHWMTHSLLTMGVFVVSGGVLLLIEPRAGMRVVTGFVAASTLLGTAVIAGYFLMR